MPKRNGIYPAGSPIFGQSSFQTQWEIKSFADWITVILNDIQTECQNAFFFFRNPVFLDTKLREVNFFRILGHWKVSSSQFTYIVA